MGTDKYTRSATGCYGLEMTGHLPVYNDVGPEIVMLFIPQ